MLVHYFTISGDLWRHGFFKCSPVLTGSAMSTCHSSLEAAHSKGQFRQQPPSYTCSLSRFRRVWLFKRPWTVAGLAPLRMGLCEQAYRGGLPCPPPGGPPDPGVHPTSYGDLYQERHLGSLRDASIFPVSASDPYCGPSKLVSVSFLEIRFPHFY